MNGRNILMGAQIIFLQTDRKGETIKNLWRFFGKGGLGLVTHSTMKAYYALKPLIGDPQIITSFRCFVALIK